ncbi:MAG: Rab family GTPase [Promethearchaeota archaeon]
MQLVKKICLIGEDGAGKTSIAIRYTQNTFTSSYLVTLGVDFYETIFKREKNGESQTISAQLWDLASQKPFKTMRSQYLDSSDFVIVVTDINRTDYKFLHPWIDDLKKFVGEETPFIIALNKIDLETPKEWNELQSKLEKQYNVKVFGTSAKTGDNVASVFDYIADYLFVHHKN